VEVLIESQSLDDPLSQGERDELVAALQNLGVQEVIVHEIQHRTRIGEVASLDGLWHLIIEVGGSSAALIAVVRGMFKAIDTGLRRRIKIRFKGLDLEMPAGASLREVEDFLQKLSDKPSKESKAAKTVSGSTRTNAKKKKKTPQQSRGAARKRTEQAP
jgi:hypothetical protein